MGREFLKRLAGRAPLLPGVDVLAFVDIDSTQKRVYCRKKQGARFGHTKIQGKSLLVRGLNALAATVSTPLAAPVIAGVRLRGGNAASARGAAGFAAVRWAGACFSVTVPVNASVRAAIAVPEGAWQAIEYPQAIWDDQLDCWVSDAEVAETTYTDFTSRKKALHVTARLIVRRMRDKGETAPGQGELFPAWGATTPSERRTARPSAVRRFNANAAWLVTAAMAFNLLRAAGALASRALAKARGATVRSALIAAAARISRHGRGRIALHLPAG